MDRAIREIIHPVVDRSVTIACMTTRELVLKVRGVLLFDLQPVKGILMICTNYIESFIKQYNRYLHEIILEHQLLVNVAQCRILRWNLMRAIPEGQLA